MVGNATAANVLADKTFTSSAGVGLTGTMVNRGTLNWNPTSSTTQTVQPGYYSGGTLNSAGAYNKGKTDGTTATKVGTAAPGQVLAGKTFTNSSTVGATGTMKDNGAWSNTPSEKGKVTIPAGYHNGSGYVDTTSVYNKGVTDTQLSNLRQLSIGYGNNITIPSGSKIVMFHGGTNRQWDCIYLVDSGLILNTTHLATLTGSSVTMMDYDNFGSYTITKTDVGISITGTSEQGFYVANWSCWG